MHNSVENKDLGIFLKRAVHSFTALDIIMHYARQPNSQETPKSISRLLGQGLEEITYCLERLVEGGALQKIKKKDDVWYLPSNDLKKSDMLKLIKQCLDDKDKRIKLISAALSAIREQKSGKRRKIQ